MISNEFRPQSLKAAPRLQPLKRAIIKNHPKFFSNLTDSQYLIFSFGVILQDQFLPQCLINGILKCFEIILRQKNLAPNNSEIKSLFFLESKILSNSSFHRKVDYSLENSIVLGDVNPENLEVISDFRCGTIGLIIDIRTGKFVTWISGENSIEVTELNLGVQSMMASFNKRLRPRLSLLAEKFQGKEDIGNIVFYFNS